MIKKEMLCFECSYCNRKYDNEEACLACEAKHLDQFTAEQNRFDAFKVELSNIYSKKNIRPKIINKKKVIETITVDTGQVDEHGQPIMQEQQVEKWVNEEILGDVPVIHCSKCLRLIHENAIYLKAFGYILCLECALPLFRNFAKNYTNFRNNFANLVGNNTITPGENLSTPSTPSNDHNCSCNCSFLDD